MGDYIHFLNTNNSDCIVLESDGHFAMIDAAEDTEYPKNKPHLKLKGYEDVVVDYLLKHCMNENGRVHLDFVLGTHAHSDHIGGFDTVIKHPLVDIDKAFLRKYDESHVFIMERKAWDNVEVYTQMVDALKEKNVPIVEEMNGMKLSLGDFKITLYHSKVKKGIFKFGENVNSVAALVQAGPAKALLVGDINYKDGYEVKLAKEIGKVDLLKVGHHGHFFSTSFLMVKKLMPSVAVVTHSARNIMADVKFKLKSIAKAKIFSTVDCDGVIAKVCDNGFEMIPNIM